jgi:hypothetical protein
MGDEERHNNERIEIPEAPESVGLDWHGTVSRGRPRGKQQGHDMQR